MLRFLTAAPDPVGQAEGSLLQYGALGAGVLFLGWIVWRFVQRGWAREDALEARLYALQDSVRTEVVPALTRAIDVLNRVHDASDPERVRRS